MAAITYAKCNEKLGACVVTTGCGGTNAITACLHAWQDSVPCIFISGQAARHQTIRNSNVPLRQKGRQEADIVSIVTPITKWAVMINEPQDSASIIDKAIFTATTGRKGPVWLDIPLDVQSAIVDTDIMERCVCQEDKPIIAAEDLKEIQSALANAQRPVLLVGNGVRLAGGLAAMRVFVEKAGIPVVYSRLGHDFMDAEDPLYIGMIGMLGATRAGNFALQNADVIVCIGCRLSINTTGYEYEKFAREAKVIVVDIDAVEHQKQTVKIDKFVLSDAKAFFEQMQSMSRLPIDAWREKCVHWKETFPTCEEARKHGERIDMYWFIQALSEALPNNATIVSDAGNSYYITTSGVHVNPSKGQRSITSAAQAEMGYTLPGTIGASFATGELVVGVSGDGSVMMNIQDMATLAFQNRNIKLFIMNNGGYSSIRQLQNTSFRGRLIGCDPQSGLGMPNFENVIKAFGLQYARIEGSENLSQKIADVLSMEGCVVCEVLCELEQEFMMVTTAMNSKRRMVMRPLEDQAPFMDRELFAKEMIITPLD
jgi:acetolactate synthase-1/2/3 large subunit